MFSIQIFITLKKLLLFYNAIIVWDTIKYVVIYNYENVIYGKK